MRIVLPRLAFILSLVSAALGADSTGTIEGRVSDPASAEFLERVRITVEGTPLETFTDTAGFYRVSGLSLIHI
jgi:hypothetical protein